MKLEAKWHDACSSTETNSDGDKLLSRAEDELEPSDGEVRFQFPELDRTQTPAPAFTLSVGAARSAVVLIRRSSARFSLRCTISNSGRYPVQVRLAFSHRKHVGFLSSHWQFTQGQSAAPPPSSFDILRTGVYLHPSLPTRSASSRWFALIHHPSGKRFNRRGIAGAA